MFFLFSIKWSTKHCTIIALAVSYINNSVTDHLPVEPTRSCWAPSGGGNRKMFWQHTGCWSAVAHGTPGTAAFHCTVCMISVTAPSPQCCFAAVWMSAWPCSCSTATTQILRFARWLSESWRRWKTTTCSGIFSSLCRYEYLVDLSENHFSHKKMVIFISF